MIRTLLLVITVVFSSSSLAGVCKAPSGESGTIQFYASKAEAIAACDSTYDAPQSQEDYYGFGCNGTIGIPQNGYKALNCRGDAPQSARSSRWMYPDSAPACVLPETVNPETGDCYDADAPITCSIQQSPVIDSTGQTTSCMEPDDPAEACDSVGIINGIEYCAKSSAACEAAGGTYGYASIGENVPPSGVCVEQSIPPDCASGAVVVVVLSDPPTQSCVQPDQLPTNRCDGTLYDCDGDGNIDDQNKNGVTDNGIEDDPLVQIPDPIVDPITGLPVDNVGYDDLEPAIEGAGDCDPSAQNYAECAGFVDNSPSEDTRGDQDGISSSTPDEVASDIITRLYAAPLVAMVGNITGIFDLSGAQCPAPTFSAFNTSFVLDGHCSLYSTIAGILSTVMIILFSIIGVRHIASA